MAPAGVSLSCRPQLYKNIGAGYLRAQSPAVHASVLMARQSYPKNIATELSLTALASGAFRPRVLSRALTTLRHTGGILKYLFLVSCATESSEMLLVPNSYYGALLG